MEEPHIFKKCACYIGVITNPYLTLSFYYFRMTGLMLAGMNMQMLKLKLVFEAISILSIFIASTSVFADPQYQIKTKNGETFTTHHYWKEKSNTNFWIDKQEKSIPTSDISKIEDITPKTENAYPISPKTNNPSIEKDDTNKVIIGSPYRHSPSSRYRSHTSSRPPKVFHTPKIFRKRR